jgi:hypothetical protein
LPLLRTLAAAILVVGEAVPDAKGVCVLPCQYGVDRPEGDRTAVLVDSIKSFGVAQNPRDSSRGVAAGRAALTVSCVQHPFEIRHVALLDAPTWDRILLDKWHSELTYSRQSCLV